VPAWFGLAKSGLAHSRVLSHPLLPI